MFGNPLLFKTPHLYSNKYRRVSNQSRQNTPTSTVTSTEESATKAGKTPTYYNGLTNHYSITDTLMYSVPCILLCTLNSEAESIIALDSTI